MLDVYECDSFLNCLPETTFCAPGVQTSSADKHVDRKSRVSKAGWYGSLDFVFPLFIFVFFALRASRSISGAQSLPSFDLHSRRSAFGTLTAQLLFKLAHRGPMRSNLACLPPTSFPLARLIIQFTNLDRKQCRFIGGSPTMNTYPRWSDVHREIWAPIARDNVHRHASWIYNSRFVSRNFRDKLPCRKIQSVAARFWFPYLFEHAMLHRVQIYM